MLINIPIYSYILILISLFFNYTLGTFITKKSLELSLLSGICLSAGVLSISCWFIPNMTKEIILLIFSAGFINYIFNIKNIKFKDFKNKLIYSAKNNWIIIFILILSFIFFNKFHYSEYSYNSHDPWYWGFAFESLKADYYGPLKHPTFFPAQIGISHVISSMVLASLNVFIPEPTLLTLIEAKYILISIFFSLLSLSIIKKFQLNFLIYILCFYLSFKIFELEIGYNLLVSSYFYVLLLSSFCFLMIDNKNNKLELLFLLAFMIINKGPIFYVSSITFLYLLYYNYKYLLNTKIIIAILLVFLNILTWYFFPKIYDNYCVDLSYKIINPFNLKDVATFIQLRDWVMPDNIINYIYSITEDREYFDIINNLKTKEYYMSLVHILPFILYILIKYYLYSLFLIKFYFKKNSDQLLLYNSMYTYIFVGLIGWLFLRNGINIAHQTHNYLLLSTICFILTIIITTINKKLIIILAITATIVNYNILFEKPFTKTLSIGIAKNNLKLNKMNFNNISYKEYYYPPKNEKIWISEIKSLILGKRILANTYNKVELNIEFFGEDLERLSLISKGAIINSNTDKKCD